MVTVLFLFLFFEGVFAGFEEEEEGVEAEAEAAFEERGGIGAGEIVREGVRGRVAEGRNRFWDLRLTAARTCTLQYQTRDVPN